MPKSKRNKQVELSKTKKRGLEWKKSLFEEVRSCVDKYANVFVFSVNDMRNSKMKNVREQWKHSRFFIGKNKIMAMALGRFDEEEYRPNLHKLGQQIKGQRGLLFSNKSIEEVLDWFRSYSEGDYARSGNTATEAVNLPAGPLTMFPHNLEPYLRQLGLPTSLEKGVIHLIKDHEVCKVGDVLTPETAKILKLLGYEMAEFHITIDCVWSQDGSFMQITDKIDSGKENAKKGRKTSLGGKVSEKSLQSQDVEEMEVEFDEENDSDDENNSDEEENNSSAVNTESTFKESNGVKENSKSESQESSENVKDCTNETADMNVSSDIDETVEDSESVAINEITNISKSTGVQEDASSKAECEITEEIVNINGNESAVANEDASSKVECEVTKEIVNSNGNESAGVKEDTLSKIECEATEEVVNINSNESAGVNEDTSSKIECEITEDIVRISDDELTDVKMSTPANTRKSRATTRKSVKSVKGKQKKVSLPKTPDADTSQDSPVFRELRNRAVKFSSKKKK